MLLYNVDTTCCVSRLCWLWTSGRRRRCFHFSIDEVSMVVCAGNGGAMAVVALQHGTMGDCSCSCTIPSANNVDATRRLAVTVERRGRLR